MAALAITRAGTVVALVDPPSSCPAAAAPSPRPPSVDEVVQAAKDGRWDVVHEAWRHRRDSIPRIVGRIVAQLARTDDARAAEAVSRLLRFRPVDVPLVRLLEAALLTRAPRTARALLRHAHGYCAPVWAVEVAVGTGDVGLVADLVRAADHNAVVVLSRVLARAAEDGCEPVLAACAAAGEAFPRKVAGALESVSAATADALLRRWPAMFAPWRGSLSR